MIMISRAKSGRLKGVIFFMHILARDASFPARLTDGSGHILAEGTASILKEKGAVEFESDFVPLYPLGTFLTVERIYNGEVIHRFQGDVYLSDKQLLRLTGVTDELLPGSELVYEIEVMLKAQLTKVAAEAPASKRFFRRSIPEPLQVSPVVIKMLSFKGVEFDSTETLDPEAQYSLSLEGDTLKDIPIKVDKIYAFSEGIGYFCRFGELPASSKQRLDAFILNLHQKNNKIF